MEYKRCPKCDADLPVNQFGKNRSTRDGLTAYCRTHWREVNYAWRDAHPEKHKLSKQKATIKALYGLSWDEVEAMIADQGGACAVCHEPLGERWHVDHNHDTGAVRGILHGPCNAMLGMAGDNAERLALGADYLRIRG